MNYLDFLNSMVKTVKDFEQTECNDDDYYCFYMNVKSLLLYDKPFDSLTEKEQQYIETQKWSESLESKSQKFTGVSNK